MKKLTIDSKTVEKTEIHPDNLDPNVIHLKVWFVKGYDLQNLIYQGILAGVGGVDMRSEHNNILSFQINIGSRVISEPSVLISKYTN